MGLTLLNTMDAHQVAAGFLGAKKVVAEKTSFNVNEKGDIERVATLLESFKQKQQGVVTRTVLKVMETAYDRSWNESAGLAYLYTLSEAIARTLPSPPEHQWALAEWCFTLLGRAAKTKYDRVAMAAAHWLARKAAISEETTRLNPPISEPILEAVQSALRRRKKCDQEQWHEDVKEELVGLEAQLAQWMPSKKKRRVN